MFDMLPFDFAVPCDWSSDDLVRDRRRAKHGQSPVPLPWSSCLLIGFAIAVIVQLLI